MKPLKSIVIDSKGVTHFDIADESDEPMSAEPTDLSANLEATQKAVAAAEANSPIGSPQKVAEDSSKSPTKSADGSPKATSPKATSPKADAKPSSPTANSEQETFPKATCPKATCPKATSPKVDAKVEQSPKKDATSDVKVAVEKR